MIGLDGKIPPFLQDARRRRTWTRHSPPRGPQAEAHQADGVSSLDGVVNLELLPSGSLYLNQEEKRRIVDIFE